jgi:hypothetical protein
VSHPAEKQSAADLDDSRTVTSEVGDEGGSPGDLEVEIDRRPATGREADETLRPVHEQRDVVARDETGVGRRSP